MLTTTIPASWARLQAETSALESAGASTMRIDSLADHLIDQAPPGGSSRAHP